MAYSVEDFGDLGLYRIYQTLSGGGLAFVGITEQQMFNILNDSSALGSAKAFFDPYTGSAISEFLESVADITSYSEYKNKSLNNALSQLVGNLGVIQKLKNISVINPNTYDVWIKIWMLPAASVTFGTTETDYKIQVPANGSVILNDTNFCLVSGSACTMAATLNRVDSDTTAIATGVEVYTTLKYR